MRAQHHGSMAEPKRRPGDLLLDRYFPDADKETREAARAQFGQFAEAIFRVGVRLAHEEATAADSPKTDWRPTISPTPDL